MSSARWHRQNVCLLQLGVLGDDIYFDTMYDREIIIWAVQRMRPGFKHLRMCAAGGTLIVWEASRELSLEECISKGPFLHNPGSCLLHIELPMNDYFMSADRRMIGNAFEIGRAFHGAKNIEWMSPGI
ncbi:hypothetical protein CVIRNUC_010387 [Coccomyxa viridis]|jgi:hypothetical protein|uniref:Uncharacterized protein n=1 Tax=Coccomyxa viridis TaxID=1274662 RepID=A0AAV1IIL2_9CHLO|nr:hypothetical protein CVIRNUC_010387 [Coccomyxa viridis]